MKYHVKITDNRTGLVEEEFDTELLLGGRSGEKVARPIFVHDADPNPIDIAAAVCAAKALIRVIVRNLPGIFELVVRIRVGNRLANVKKAFGHKK